MEATKKHSETEKVILHFNFSHLPADTEFTMSDSSRPVRLKLHTPETRLKFSKTNKLLGLLSEEHLNQFSHFAEEVEFSTLEVSTCVITYPSKKPGAAAGALAGIYTHKPYAAVKRAVENNMLHSSLGMKVPARLEQYGLEDIHEKHPHLLQGGAGDLFADAGYTINYKDTAIKLVMQHPDITSVLAESVVRLEELILTDVNFKRFSTYIKNHFDEDDDSCFYENTVSRDLKGNIMEPCDGLTDADGLDIKWHKQNGKNVIAQYNLTDGVAKAIAPVLKSVLERVNDNPLFKGENWNTQNGATSRTRSGDDTKLISMFTAADDNSGRWTMTAPPSQHGLDIYYDTISFDSATKKLTFEVKNWANRWLGVYCQFIKADGKTPIDNPADWKKVPSGLGDYEPSLSKKYLDALGPGCVIFGAPVADLTLRTRLTFPIPDDAASVKILFGGLGDGTAYDSQVDKLGVTYTALLSYSLPTVLSIMSVGMQCNKKYIAYFENRRNVALVASIAAAYYAPLFIEGSKRMGTEGVLAKTGEFGVGLLFNFGLKTLAMHITKEVKFQSFLQNHPMMGWALKIASLASSLASMISTSVSVAKSPSTIVFEAKRSMDLDVTIHPDPTHGTSTQKPIWPETGTKYSVLIKYDGIETTLKKDGLLPAKNDEPLKLVFSKATKDELAVIPGKKFQVVAIIYTKNDSIVGLWSSDPKQLVPEKDNKVTEEGSIIEKLVPLVSSTLYEHKKKLSYNASGRKYEWALTTTPPSKVHSSLATQKVSQLNGLTLNNLAYKLGYTYQASDQNLPLDNDTTRKLNTPMHVMKNISTLNDPGAGMKSSAFGMSQQPSIAYDQFGPFGLFTLEPAEDFMKDLNNGKISDSVKAIFRHHKLELPAGATVKTNTKDASWSVSVPGKPNPVYDLRRQVDTIKIFLWPVPEFSPNNFFLDTRTYASQGVFHLRLVDLKDSGNPHFGKDSDKSWGTFNFKVQDMKIHPAGYAVAINYDDSMISILKLEKEGKPDSEATPASAYGGRGWREGLLKGPVAMTITADGRILILESQNSRIQSFDTSGNPVPCFKTKFSFSIPADFANDLKSKTFSVPFWQEIQKQIPVWNTEDAAHPQRYMAMPKLSAPASVKAGLDNSVADTQLREAFSVRNMALGNDLQIAVTVPGQKWILRDKTSGFTYDIRYRGENTDEVNVYMTMALSVSEIASGTHWLISDNGNALTFDVVKEKDKLSMTRLSSMMMLKDKDSSTIYYLDIACETKGYIYVLSYQRPGTSVNDYRLDIYQPDGTPLTESGHNGNPAAAKLAIDQWRNMFTLNYEQMEGAEGRPEPNVSLWIPNA